MVTMVASLSWTIVAAVNQLVILVVLLVAVVGMARSCSRSSPPT